MKANLKKYGPFVTVLSLIFATSLWLAPEGGGEFNSIPDYMLCPYLKLTSFRCPLCGMTRAFVQAAHFEFQKAFLFSPAGTFLFIYMCAYIAVGWFYIATNAGFLKRFLDLRPFRFIVIVVLASWVVRAFVPGI